MTALSFLECNGYRSALNEAEAITTMLSLAAGQLSEEQFASWLRQRITRA